MLDKTFWQIILNNWTMAEINNMASWVEEAEHARGWTT